MKNCVQVGQICHERGGHHTARARVSLLFGCHGKRPFVLMSHSPFFLFSEKISGLNVSSCQKRTTFLVVLFSPHSSAVSIHPALESRLHNKFFRIIRYISETRNDSVNTNKLSKRKDKKKNGNFWKCFSIRPLLFSIQPRGCSRNVPFRLYSDIESWRLLRNHFLAFPGSWQNNGWNITTKKDVESLGLLRKFEYFFPPANYISLLDHGWIVATHGGRDEFNRQREWRKKILIWCAAGAHQKEK